MTDSKKFFFIENATKLPKDTLIVVREYSHPDRDKKISEWIAVRRGKNISVAGKRVRKVEWIHLPAHKIKLAIALRRAHKKLKFTCAVHSIAELKMAEKAKIDAVFISPVFATTSHSGKNHLGKYRAKLLACKTALPVVFLGGVTFSNLGELWHPRVVGVSGIDLFGL